MEFEIVILDEKEKELQIISSFGACIEINDYPVD